MKIIVTGAKGQLGSHLLEVLKDYEVFGVDMQDFDITDAASVSNYIEKVKPDVIIHPAAMTNVDGCESDPITAYRVNALGTGNLAREAQKCGAKFVYISTDYVFEGNGTKPYVEYDRVNPQGAYGKSKLAGEEITKMCCQKSFIIRVAWLYGVNGKNFVKTMINVGREKGHLDVVDDQRGTPTYAKDVAEVIEKLIKTENYGIYHATNEGECTWFDFAKRIIELSEVNAEVAPTTSDKLKRPTKRPTYSVLENVMLKCLDIEMRDWESALEEYIEKLKINEMI